MPAKHITSRTSKQTYLVAMDNKPQGDIHQLNKQYNDVMNISVMS